MASYSHVKSVHKTLTGTTADTVTLTQMWEAIQIDNEDMVNDLFVRQDGTTAVADADGTTRIAPGSTSIIKSRPDWANNQVVISVVGNGGAYHIEGVQ